VLQRNIAARRRHAACQLDAAPRVRTLRRMLTACAGCGARLARSDIFYTRAAWPVCARCNDRADLADADDRVAGNIRHAALLALAAGAAAALAPLIGFLAAIACCATAVTSAAYALRSLRPRNARFLVSFTRSARAAYALAAVLGLALALVGAFELTYWLPGSRPAPTCHLRC
jgi:hypothetical protein